MLTLTRRSGERIRIGQDILITIKEIHGNQVKIGIEAPRSVQVFREELYTKLAEAPADDAPVPGESLEHLVALKTKPSGE